MPEAPSAAGMPQAKLQTWGMLGRNRALRCPVEQARVSAQQNVSHILLIPKRTGSPQSRSEQGG
eukprot:9284034-Pyramimonas_sp.AAC.1